MFKSAKPLRKIDKRRIIAIIIIIAIVSASLLYFFISKNKPTEISASTLKTGDISSKMYVKAQIKPDSVASHTIKQRQRVVTVNVKPGDQVKAGDILLTLDQQELQDQYETAKKARQEIEKANAAKQKSAKADAVQAEIKQKDFEIQINNLTGALTRIIANIALLNVTPNSNVNFEMQLAEIIQSQLINFDPASPDVNQQVQALVDSIMQGVNVSANPEYADILLALQNDSALLASSLPKVLSGIGGGLTSSLTSSIDISSALSSQLQSLGLNTSDPLVSALALEKSYKAMLDESVTILTAKISGIVAEVNTQAGSYIGSSSAPVDSSLSSLISGTLGNTALQSLGGSATSQTAAVVIYDNTALKAVFQVSQFDSVKLQLGMSVDYSKDNKNTENFQGKITYKSPFVQDSSLASGNASDLLASAGIVSALGQDPKLIIEMSITGDNLTGLVLGFLIDAQINTASASNVILLPAQAMRRELDEYYVFVVDANNRLSKKPFIPGIQSDMFVEVSSGLTTEDIVVQNPTATLQAGQRVSIGTKGN